MDRIILQRVAIRMTNLDENNNFIDCKKRGKICFYPKEPNGRNRVKIYFKRKGYTKFSCFYN